MCGIAGFIDYFEKHKNREECIDNMIECLKYRGPNSKGKVFDTFASLGHTRLAVVDVELGLQPMSIYKKGVKYTIVYNGELYNTEDLRKDLSQKGYKFHTKSDTEVLLAMYIEYGYKCPEKLNGIFAFAIWDGRELFLARDRFGVKPLFFTLKDGVFIFASEIKAIFKHEKIKPIIDKQGLCEIFALGPARTPSCGVFKGINELKPSHFAIYNRSGLEQEKYFELTAKQHEDNYTQTVEKVRYLLSDAVKRQLVSDVPICTLLSGGVDSSIISAIASKHLKSQGKTLSTYSFDFEKNDEYFVSNTFQPMQDRPFVDLMVEKIGSNHKHLEISYKDSLDALFEAVIAKDLPSMTDIDSSLMCFSRLIKENHTVCLSGECADEIFGGYPWFYDKKTYTDEVFPWSRDMNLRQNIVNPKLNLNLKDYAKEQYLHCVKSTDCLSSDSAERRKEREIMMLNVGWFMQTLLDRKDRMTMRASLEVRVPFADHRLIEYLYNVPWEYKSKNGVKGLLKDAFKDIIPFEILYRKKTPYPKTYNPKFESELKDMLAKTIKDGSRIKELINIDYLNKLFEQNSEQATPWFGQLMKKPQVYAYLLQIDFWLKFYDIQVLF